MDLIIKETNFQHYQVYQWLDSPGIGKHLQKISFSEASLMLPHTNSDTINNNDNPLPRQEDLIVTKNTNNNSPSYAHYGCNKAIMASLYVQANFNLITTSHNELDLNNRNIKIN